ncbi:MAG: tRNA uridine-5-carboxymethylaminomethyl(34) synthesis GTPase MnmE [Candidatus Omnitrophica bacterium]|nr:tRNA uridine-5-carboxymethylaminomethyl(34) synthesis GTPase MnmE [Candidatus Omnitrophota bacterium]
MPEFKTDDTIAAIATPIGEGGISVIRLSGDKTFEIIEKIFHPAKKNNLTEFPSHTIHLGEIRTPENELLDEVLVSFFRRPNSYTGEDIIEINCHGGMLVTKRILDLLIRSGARHAEPGEFTRRAFLNGKIDLTQAEAILDLIKAKSERSLEVAVRQLTGALSQKFKNLKNELMALYAHMEAYLDFPEEHLEICSDNTMISSLQNIRREIQKLIAGFERGAMIREGVMAVIVGKPNVGKSSFFNALLERDRALVSEFPGTTRDHLEEWIDLQGLSIRLVDTAGLASNFKHPLEHMGMEATRQVLNAAGVVLFMVDGSAPLDEEDALVFKIIENQKSVLVLINKSDLPAKLDEKKLKSLSGDKKIIKISAKTREGFDWLETSVVEIILGKNSEAESEQITRLRHKHALHAASEALEHAAKALGRKESLELVTFDLKSALQSLQELIGEIYSEDLLDVIFAEFCIGK